MDVSFEELALSQFNSIEDFQKKFKVGTKCKNCLPYIEQLINTGETKFSVIE
jgi:NAD(P)H-nitrite reductase large subunit